MALDPNTVASTMKYQAGNSGYRYRASTTTGIATVKIATQAH
jgi:hypothetical protein